MLILVANWLNRTKVLKAGESMAEVRKHKSGNTALEQFVMQAFDAAPKKVEPSKRVERDYDEPVQLVEEKPTQAAMFETSSDWLTFNPTQATER